MAISSPTGISDGNGIIPNTGIYLPTGISESLSGGAPAQTYATLNPADMSSGGGIALSGGNLIVTRDTDNIFRSVRATIGQSSGKWTFRVIATSAAGGAGEYAVVGPANLSAPLNDGTAYPGGDANGAGYFNFNGNILQNNVSSPFGVTWTTGDAILFAVDVDNGVLTTYKNGSTTPSGGPVSLGISGALYPMLSLYTASVLTFDAGETPFAWVPTGYNNGWYTP